MSELYDIVIIGGGPAGLAAGIYGGRAKLKTVILEKGEVGGMACTTREMVNYPGFKNTTGPDLTAAMADHAREFGAEIIREEVVAIELAEDIKTIKTKKGQAYKTQTVIIAVGSQPRLLNIPGEKELRGSGVSYCATCDADFYQNLHVVVVGNGDAAVEEAMYITKFANQVSIIVIHDEGHLDCNKVSAEKAFQNEKIEFIWNSVVEEIFGEDEVTGVVLKNLKTGELTDFKTDGIFIYVGNVPGTDFLKGKVEMDERGYILANDMMETSVSGVYAAGDSRVKYLRQVVTAAADGATAAVAAERYIAEREALQEAISDKDKPLLMAFWSPVVGESLDFISSLEQAFSETGDKFRLMKVDMSCKKNIAKKYNVSKIPSVYLLKDGKEPVELGEIGASDLEKLLKDN
jgi:thioredoxin reductase (NADPH)